MERFIERLIARKQCAGSCRELPGVVGSCREDVADIADPTDIAGQATCAASVIFSS